MGRNNPKKQVQASNQKSQLMKDPKRVYVLGLLKEEVSFHEQITDKGWIYARLAVEKENYRKLLILILDQLTQLILADKNRIVDYISFEPLLKNFLECDNNEISELSNRHINFFISSLVNLIKNNNFEKKEDRDIALKILEATLANVMIHNISLTPLVLLALEDIPQNFSHNHLCLYSLCILWNQTTDPAKKQSRLKKFELEIANTQKKIEKNPLLKIDPKKLIWIFKYPHEESASFAALCQAMILQDRKDRKEIFMYLAELSIPIISRLRKRNLSSYKNAFAQLGQTIIDLLPILKKDSEPHYSKIKIYLLFIISLKKLLHFNPVEASNHEKNVQSMISFVQALLRDSKIFFDVPELPKTVFEKMESWEVSPIEPVLPKTLPANWLKRKSPLDEDHTIHHLGILSPVAKLEVLPGIINTLVQNPIAPKFFNSYCEQLGEILKEVNSLIKDPKYLVGMQSLKEKLYYHFIDNIQKAYETQPPALEDIIILYTKEIQSKADSKTFVKEERDWKKLTIFLAKLKMNRAALEYLSVLFYLLEKEHLTTQHFFNNPVYLNFIKDLSTILNSKKQFSEQKNNLQPALDNLCRLLDLIKKLSSQTNDPGLLFASNQALKALLPIIELLPSKAKELTKPLGEEQLSAFMKRITEIDAQNLSLTIEKTLDTIIADTFKAPKKKKTKKPAMSFEEEMQPLHPKENYSSEEEGEQEEEDLSFFDLDENEPHLNADHLNRNDNNLPSQRLPRKKFYGFLSNGQIPQASALLIEIGNTDTILTFIKGHQHHKNFESLVIRTAITYENKNDLESAKRFLTSVTSYKKSSLLMVSLAICLKKNGEKEEALKTLTLAQLQFPKDSTVLKGMAQWHISQEEYLDALYYYNKILKGNIKHEIALLGRARCLREIGLYDESIAAYKKMPDYRQNESAQLGLANTYTEKKEFDTAISICKNIPKWEQNEKVLLQLAILSERSSEFPEAYRYISGITIKPDNKNILLYMMKFYFKRGLVKAANEIMQRLATAYRNDPQVYVHCYRLSRYSGFVDPKKFPSIDDMLKKYPANPDLYLIKALFEKNQKNYPAATEILEATIKEFPTYPYAYKDLLWLSCAMENTQRAQELLEICRDKFKWHAKFQAQLDKLVKEKNFSQKKRITLETTEKRQVVLPSQVKNLFAFFAKFPNVYLVGSSVIDLLKKNKLASDFDFVIFMKREDIAILEKENFRQCPFNKDLYQGMVQGMRIDCMIGNYDTSDLITFTDDMLPRDYSIGSLLCNSKGQVFDPTKQAFEDLDKNLVNSCRNPLSLFLEDPVRILRGIKLAVKGYTLAEEIIKAFQNFEPLQECIEGHQGHLLAVLKKHYESGIDFQSYLAILEKFDLAQKLFGMHSSKLVESLLTPQHSLRLLPQGGFFQNNTVAKEPYIPPIPRTNHSDDMQYQSSKGFWTVRTNYENPSPRQKESSNHNRNKSF